MGLFDFAKPKWQHKSPAVRLAALKELGDDDLEIIIKLVCEDEDQAVRHAALGRISDVDSLAKLCSGELDPELRQKAHERLNGILRDTVHAAAGLEEKQAALMRIDDTELLAAIAVEAESPEIRLQAIERIDDQEVLCRIVEQQCGKAAALAAVHRMDQEALLQQVAAKGANRVARHLAREKLSRLEAERNRPSAAEAATQKLQALLDAAAALTATGGWEAALKRSAGLEEQWRDIDADGSHPLRTSFEAARARLEGEAQAQRARSAEERRRAEVLEQQKAAAEKIIQTVDELTGAISEDSEARFQAASAEWESYVAVHGNDVPAAYGERFAEACRRYGTVRETAAREGDLLQELTGLCAALEASVSDSVPDEFLPRLAELNRRFMESPFSYTATADLAERLAALKKAGEERRRAEEERLAGERAANARQGETICAELEALIEAEHRMKAEKRVRELRTTWEEMPDPDGEGGQEIKNRYRELLDRFYTRQQEFYDEQEWKRWANKTMKEDLCERVEALDAEEDLAVVARAVQDAKSRWKKIGPVPKEDVDAIRSRFHAACERNWQRCGPYFEEQERQRAANQLRKEELCRQAEAHADSTEWKKSSAALKKMQAEWKATGAAPRAVEEQLFSRFRAACDRFFERRKAHYDELDKGREQNLVEKEKICAEAEALAREPQWEYSRQFRELQRAWKAAGPAPRKDEQKIWERFRAACDLFFNWLDEQRQANLGRKEALCEEVEGLLAGAAAAETDMNEVAARIADLQKQWKEIGPAPKDKKEEVWQRFHGQCEAFFSARRSRREDQDKQRQENQLEKEKIVRRAEELVEADGNREAADELRLLQKQWRETGPGLRDQEPELRKRFKAACDCFFAGRRQQFEKLQQARAVNLKKKEALCLELENLIGLSAPSAGESAGAGGLTLAEQLKHALESNIMLAGVRDDERRLGEEVRRLQQEWKRIGPVPREHEKKLRKRYRRALDAFYDKES